MALFWQSVKSNHPTYYDNRTVGLLLEFTSIFKTQFETELGIRVVGLDSLLISLP